MMRVEWVSNDTSSRTTFVWKFLLFLVFLNYGTTLLVLICSYLERKQNMRLFNLCGTNSSCVSLIMLRTKRILRPSGATGLDPEKLSFSICKEIPTWLFAELWDSGVTARPWCHMYNMCAPSHDFREFWWLYVTQGLFPWCVTSFSSDSGVGFSVFWESLFMKVLLFLSETALFLYQPLKKRYFWGPPLNRK